MQQFITCIVSNRKQHSILLTRGSLLLLHAEAGLLNQNQIHASMVEIFGQSVLDQETALPNNIRVRIAMATNDEVDGEEDSATAPHQVMPPQPFEPTKVVEEDADMENMFNKAAQYGVAQIKLAKDKAVDAEKRAVAARSEADEAQAEIIRLTGDLKKINTENE